MIVSSATTWGAPLDSECHKTYLMPHLDLWQYRTGIPLTWRTFRRRLGLPI